MKRTWVYDKNGHAHEVHREVSEHHFVQPDIAEHGGKANWREYLKRTGTIEVSHSDLKRQHERWQARQAEHADKMKVIERQSKPIEREIPLTAENQYQRTRLNQEMANRLDGRPAPERKMLIKMTLDEARRLNRR